MSIQSMKGLLPVFRSSQLIAAVDGLRTAEAVIARYALP